MNSDFHWAKEKQCSVFAINIIRKSLVGKINLSGLGKISFSPWPNRTLIFNLEHNHFGGGGWVAKLYPTLVTPWTIAYQAPLSMEFPRKNIAVSCHFLIQGTFPNQGSNLGLFHCRQILYQLSHQGSPENNHTRTIKGTLLYRISNTVEYMP